MTEYAALARRALAVASTRIEGTWKAYIDAVDGHNHDLEAQEVLDQGSPLPEDVARLLFRGSPWAQLPYSP